MFLVAWIVLGVVAGVVFSKFIYHDRRTYAADIVLGVFGALVGGAVYSITIARGAVEYGVWPLLSVGVGAAIMCAGFHILRRTGRGV
jgi:uncharacterized membrane protein YeaQ/YmgE (transglycosylase-associated protein family)